MPLGTKPRMRCKFVIFCLLHVSITFSTGKKAILPVDIGVILDAGSLVGITSNSSMSMALEDFYTAAGRDYQTRLNIYYRDSQHTPTGAASAANDLIRSKGVQAIIGPQTSEEAAFVAYMGSEAQVPIVTFSAVSTQISSTVTPYFIRMAQSDSSQARAIAALLNVYGWRSVILIHDDSFHGTGIIYYLTEALQNVGITLLERVVLPTTSSQGTIRDAVINMSTKNVKIFIVHLPLFLGERFFRLAAEAEMMADEHGWIITSRLANVIPSMDPSVVSLMDGALGVKAHVPNSSPLANFTVRWKQKLRREHPELDATDVNIYSLWAYDTIWLMAMAAEKAFATEQVVSHSISTSEGPDENFTRFMQTDISSSGSQFLKCITHTRFTGLSGRIELDDGQLVSNTFQIINVVDGRGRKAGYWTTENGITRSLENPSAGMGKLDGIIWPGGTTVIPKNQIAINSNDLVIRVGVPVKLGYREFVKVEWDHQKNKSTVDGFSTAMFLAVKQALPYRLTVDFIPYDNGRVDDLGYYDELIYQVYLKKYDAVVGDTTITANRSNYIDYTQPYTESGISMIVPVVTDDVTKRPWWFLQPLSKELWLATIGISILKGLLVWLFEHGINDEFDGTLSQQVGKILYYSFTTFVFANQEKLETNHSRFVISLWTFIVFVLVTSYGANLTSMLTVEKLRPKVTDLQTLIKNNEKIGYQNGSFVAEFLKQQGAVASELRAYDTAEEYAEALSRGSDNNGVSAIVDEIPYIKVFLGRYCHNFTTAGRTFRTGGFGFVFPRGSPLVNEISRAIVQFNEDRRTELEATWFHNLTCPDALDTNQTNYELPLKSFHVIYAAVLAASGLAVVSFFLSRLHESRKDARVSAEEASAASLDVTPMPHSVSSNGTVHIISESRSPSLQDTITLTDGQQAHSHHLNESSLARAGSSLRVDETNGSPSLDTAVAVR